MTPAGFICIIKIRGKRRVRMPETNRPTQAGKRILHKRKKKMSECFAGFKKSCTFAPLFRGVAFQATHQGSQI